MMSNNNEAAEEADNNNEQEHRENNQNQNNPPEWGAFPDLLRVQEPQQNGGGPEAAGLMQRAGTSNPPDVSLPGAAGRDPPPPDFDLVIQSGNQNQRLPDMALDANQAQQHRSLPDMALDASGLPRERPVAPSCSGARFRPRRGRAAGGSPGSLAQMAQAATAGGADNGIDTQSHQDPINARSHELEEQVQALRMHVYETDRMRSGEASRILDELASLRRSIDVAPRENPALENRLINIESLIQRMVAPRAEVSDEANRAYRAREIQRQQRETERLSRLLAESLQLALTHFMQQLGNVDRAEDENQPEP